MSLDFFNLSDQFHIEKKCFCLFESSGPDLFLSFTCYIADDISWLISYCLLPVTLLFNNNYQSEGFLFSWHGTLFFAFILLSLQFQLIHYWNSSWIIPTRNNYLYELLWLVLTQFHVLKNKDSLFIRLNRKRHQWDVTRKDSFICPVC